jgi:uncharacterized membrane protein YedE/YeeE
MRTTLTALLVGVVFGAGIALSDMINPARVLAFLDVAGSWDPTLAFVMGGALIPAALAFAARPHLGRPFLDSAFHVPENRTPDLRLLAGSGIFGIGWGLVGFCPGPVIAGLVLGLWQPWLFVAAMLTGMILERLLPLQFAPRRSSPTAG